MRCRYQHAQDVGQLPVCNQGWAFANLGLLTAALRVYVANILPATWFLTEDKTSSPIKIHLHR